MPLIRLVCLLLFFNFIYWDRALSQDSINPALQKPRSFKTTSVPALGGGFGYLSYSGDIKDTEKTLPFINRLGYQFSLSTDVSTFLTLRLSGMRGKVRADESTAARHLNFESRIVSGGLSAVYNFDHLLKPVRKLSPLLSMGLAFTDFRAKGDLTTTVGDINYEYYYWSDGTIHSIPEGSTTPGTTLSRDNIYETDLRDADLDGLGKYPQTALSIPLGAGMRYQATKRLRFELMSALNLVFTDNIDNITSAGTGSRKGNSGNDKLFFTGVSVHYDLLEPPPPPEEHPPDTSLLALVFDEDSDGVVNDKDLCPGTPHDVSVDTSGCPIDTDGDGVPDYLDHEINSPRGATVDIFGVAIRDTISYLTYYDTVKKPTGPLDTTPVFRVQLAAYRHGTNPSADEVDKLLSFEGVMNETTADGMTVYMVGNYPNPEEAEVKRRELLEKNILPDLKLIQWVPIYRTDIVPDSAKVAELLNKAKPSEGMEDVLFRVQLGAFRFKPRTNIFATVKDIVSFKGDDGLTRYFTGEFKNYNDAVVLRDDMLSKGFKGAFVVVYKNGKRIAVGSYGNETAAGSVTEYLNNQKNKAFGQQNGIEEVKHDIRFKVQLGAFRQDVPAQVLEKFTKIGNIANFVNEEGYTVYLTGSFPNYRSALELKDKIISEFGLKEAFVTAFDNDKPIPLKDAFRTIRESGK